VSPYLPYPTSGARARNYYLLKALAHRHTVSLLALVDIAEAGAYNDQSLPEDFAHITRVIPRPTPHSKRWQQLITAARGKSYLLNLFTSVEMQDALDTIMACDHYDVVLFESVLISGYRVPGNVKVVIDQHNIEHELLQRTYQHERMSLRRFYNWQEYRLIKQAEIERCRKANLILVTSERERLLLKSMLPRNVIEVVSNGVDTDAFRGMCAEQEVAKRIVFTGAMNYHPNVDAVLSFAQKCWPLIRAQVPDAGWQIVGRNPPPEVQRLAELPGVTVTGSVPDVRPYLTASGVAIAPLHIGSGTRLKILEALAMRKAVVSTSLGCEGLSVVPGKHLIVAEEPEAFAQAVIELMKHPEKRRALGMAGRSLVEAEYSWERCGNQLLHALEKIN